MAQSDWDSNCEYPEMECKPEAPDIDLAQLNEEVHRAFGWSCEFSDEHDIGSHWVRGEETRDYYDVDYLSDLTRLLLDAQAAGMLCGVSGILWDIHKGEWEAHAMTTGGGVINRGTGTHPTSPGVALALAITEAAKASKKGTNQ